ncbi:MAG: YbdK family carboxylate-amine ligase [Bdellovibrionota bacterium]
MEIRTLHFAESQPLTLGVEVELQLLNSETLDLTTAALEILENYPNSERVKAELFQSMLEINTGICKDAHDVRKDLKGSMGEIRTLCKKMGLRVASAGTHPFANYSHRVLHPAPRYQELIDRNQWIARRLMIFGLHVHVGMRSGEHAIQMNNALLHYLPILLALSASSPYWHSEDTELASSRITFFEAIPTGGHPCLLDSWQDFELLYARLIESKAIRSTKDIWWDIRPSPSFGTLEIRICDGLPTLDETVALTALIHALCIYIDSEYMKGRRFRPPPDWIMRENKWRASRHGVEAALIINEDGATESFSDNLQRLLTTLKPIAETNQYLDEFEFIQKIIERGPSYKRQRAFAKQCGGDMKKVTESLADEFDAETPIWV